MTQPINFWAKACQTVFLLSSMLVFAVWPASAELLVSEKRRTYVASGSTAQELRWDMRVNGKAKGYFGYTKWEMKRHFDTAPTRGGCRLQNVVVWVETKIILPELDTRRITSPELKRKWGKFHTALRLHEQGHAKNATDKAAEIERFLTSFYMPYPCTRAGASAYAISGRMIRDAMKRDVSYDFRTNHGKRTGVVLE